MRSTRERGCSRAKVFRDAGGSDLIMRTISLGCGCRPLSVLRGWGRHLLSSSTRPNQCRLQDSFLKTSSSPRPSQISSPSSQHPVRFCICSALCSRPFVASSVFLAFPTFFLKPTRKNIVLRGFRRGPARRGPVWEDAIGAPTSQTWPERTWAPDSFSLRCSSLALRSDRAEDRPLKNPAVNVPKMTLLTHRSEVRTSNFVRGLYQT